MSRGALRTLGQTKSRILITGQLGRAIDQLNTNLRAGGGRRESSRARVLYDPSCRDFGQILEGEFWSFQTLIRGNNRQIVFELPELIGYRYASRDHGIPGLVTEPIRQFTDQEGNLAAVRVNILPGNVRNIRLIAVQVPIEDEDFLQPLRFAPKLPRAEKEAPTQEEC